MKFIHMADLHLDTPLVSLKNNRDLIKKRRTEQKQVFRDVINIAKNENIDFLFISGDLFEQKFVEKNTIEFLISSFELIPNTKIFIAPGNHDPYIKSSPYKTFEWSQNVTIFNGEVGMFSYDNINIYGIGFTNYEFETDEIEKIEIEDESKLNVLVVHGTLNGASKKYLDILEEVQCLYGEMLQLFDPNKDSTIAEIDAEVMEQLIYMCLLIIDTIGNVAT